MLEQELIEIWKKSSWSGVIKYDVTHLKKDFKMNLNKAEKNVIRRDRREIIVAVMTMILFGYFAYEVPFFWSKMASILCVACFGYLIYRLRVNRQKKKPVNLSLNYSEQLNEEESFMKRQAHLLYSVLYWYVLPLLGSQALFFWSLGDPASVGWTGFWADFLPTALSEKIIVTTGFVVIGVYIVWLNKKAVRLTWHPLIRQVQDVKKALNAD